MNGLLWVIKTLGSKKGRLESLPFLNMPRIYGSNPPLKRRATHQILLLFSIVIIMFLVFCGFIIVISGNYITQKV